MMHTQKSMKVVQPQEIEVWYALPALRRELALSFKKLGVDQNSISQLLGVTAAAVSLYVNSKRGRLDLTDALKQEVERSAKQIITKQDSALREIQRLLKLMWEDGTICRLHREKSVVPESCDICQGITLQ